MATKKSLVIYDGEVEELRAGDTVEGAVSSGPQTTATNNGGALVKGDWVFLSGADQVELAQANASATAKPVGMANAAIAPAASGVIALDGGVVTGLTGLTPTAKYYLDPANAGKMTETAPTTSGQYVIELGYAKSATEFVIDVKQRILLS